MNEITVQLNSGQTTTIDMQYIDSQDELFDTIADNLGIDEDGSEYLELIEAGYVITDTDGLCEHFVAGLNNESFLFHDFSEARDCDLGEDVVMAWLEVMDWDKDGIEEAYSGSYSSDEEFAQELFEQIYDIPDYLQGHIDWESVAYDIMMDYFESNGHYFRSI